MISWQLVPALRVGLALAAGIACTQLPIAHFYLFGATATLIVAALLLLLWPLSFETRAPFRGWGVLLATLSVGFVLGISNTPLPPSTAGANAKAFIVKLEHQPKKSTNWYAVDGQILSFRSDTGWTNSTSRVRVLIPPARVTKDMQAGASYLINSRLNAVGNASNPHAFDYGAYLKSQGIALQAFAPPLQIDNAEEAGVILLQKGRPPGKLVWLRSWLAHRLDFALPTPNEAAVAKALFLGDKSSLSEDTRKNYTRTGAVHVLAVSGLHTGIIASILLSVLGLFSWRRNLSWLKLLLFWSGLFGYVALTGFSPSVQRSAVMFGILFAGKILRKEANGFNSLGLSAIVLLAFNPLLLFELGFQLSYCAVAGILAFYPRLRKLFASKNYWFNTIGELNAVSIAATLGTLPLTTFYFHQFPVYFLLSGICAVPLVGFALPTLLAGVAIDGVFALFGSSAYWAYIPAYLFIWLCNACLELISSFPNALVSGLWPSTLTTTLAIISIFLFGAAVLRRRKRLYWVALASSLACASSITVSTIRKLGANQLIVYSLREDLIVDAFKQGYVVTSIVSDVDVVSTRSKETISIHRAAMNATLDTATRIILTGQLSPKPSTRFGIANGKRYAVVSAESMPLAANAPPVDVVIVPEPKAINPAQLQAAFPAATVVLKGNIPPWKREEWSSLQAQIHSLKEKGAFILETKTTTARI